MVFWWVKVVLVNFGASQCSMQRGLKRTRWLVDKMTRYLERNVTIKFPKGFTEKVASFLKAKKKAMEDDLGAQLRDWSKRREAGVYPERVKQVCYKVLE